MEMAQNHEPPKQMIIIVNGRRFLQQLNLANASYICFFFLLSSVNKKDLQNIIITIRL